MFGTCVAETILASVHVRTQKQAGHMDASDQIKLSQNILRVGGRPHMGIVQSARILQDIMQNQLIARSIALASMSLSCDFSSHFEI